MPRPAQQSITAKRKTDAIRQARRRATMVENEEPQTHEMERVVLEAFSFAWHERELAVGHDGLPAPLREFWKEMGNFALELLTVRHGYPIANARAALALAIRPRLGNHARAAAAGSNNTDDRG